MLSGAPWLKIQSGWGGVEGVHTGLVSNSTYKLNMLYELKTNKWNPALLHPPTLGMLKSFFARDFCRCLDSIRSVWFCLVYFTCNTQVYLLLSNVFVTIVKFVDDNQMYSITFLLPLSQQMFWHRWNESTCVTNNVHNGIVLFKCSCERWQWGPIHTCHF